MPVLRRMLVAVDFSVWSRHAAQHAFDVARAIGGTVTLLHVLEEQGSGPSDLDAAHALLRELSLLARRPPTCLIVPGRNEFNGPGRAADGLKAGPEAQVASAILAVADELDADLILLGLHGQGNMDGRALGRVVQRVLLGARQPVQVVPCNTHRPTFDRWERVFAENTASPPGLLHQPRVSTRAAEGTREP
ncbi:universal stress protein [Deinococcus alpinitundrae]|uniref:universal stress protein n=1 Tax=Deinococcus alpinitundrae TaxID=468913 RepID=UPI00137A5677|nr:universal stress protein [Deinococcus alpinitundrae]